jgi:stage II sporulation protein D
MLRSSGYEEMISDLSGFGFTQNTREPQYRHGLFNMPFTKLRSELKLRSAFFSVIPEGDSVLLKGKGYGHGVGLCQEGAMSMADKGFGFRQIIDFYFTGVFLGNIKDVKK